MPLQSGRESKSVPLCVCILQGNRICKDRLNDTTGVRIRRCSPSAPRAWNLWPSHFKSRIGRDRVAIPPRGTPSRLIGCILMYRPFYLAIPPWVSRSLPTAIRLTRASGLVRGRSRPERPSDRIAARIERNVFLRLMRPRTAVRSETLARSTGFTVTRALRVRCGIDVEVR